MIEFKDKETKVIEEPFASEIKEKLLRYKNGKLTNEELEQINKSKELCKLYNSIWK